MGRGLCFMARYVPCDGVAVDGDEDDGEDGCHDAVAVVVVEDRDVAGWFRAPATEARTAISTSVLGDAQPEPSRLARCISRDLRLRGFNYTSPTESVVVDDTNVYHHRRRERVTLNSCVTCRLSVGMFNSLYDTCTARFIADHTMMQ